MAGTDKPGDSLQLTRLMTLSDVVYGLVIWRLFVLFPRPEGDFHLADYGEYLSSNAFAFVLVAVGLIVTIIYWLQSNVLLGKLEKSNAKHTAATIVQLFFLLTFLLACKLGIDLGGSRATRIFESVAAALLGLSGALAWWVARRDGLLREDVSKTDALKLRDRIWAEPATALFTIPMVFIGPIFWEVSWLAYGFFVKLLKGKRRDEPEAK